MYMIRKKESVRRKLKHSSSTYLSAKFKQLRSMVKRMISDSRARFFESLEQDIKANPKRFWSVFKLGNKASSVPEQMSVPSSSKNTATGVTSVRKVVSISSVDIAEAFIQHFASVFSGDTEEPRPQLPTISCPVLQDISLSPCEFAAALRSLDVSKATGPDEISARLLKETTEQIAPSLTLLYNKSLETGVFPDEWKLANIVPIHKKDNKDHVENYRPISLLSIISKVLERCVLIRLRDHLLLMLDRAQHGFIPGKSCVTQLVEVIDYIGSLLDSGKQTDVIYLDTVCRKPLTKCNTLLSLITLRQYNISGNLLNWFTSYLLGRRQRVTVLGATSKERKVTSGVPQGSILGPMLFLLYVNDLPKTVNTSKVACFADDTKILKQVDNLQDTAGLQNDIISLNGWATDNGLTFNQMKCKCQRITRKKTPVEYPYALNGSVLAAANQEKDLGVWVSNELCWKKQVVEQTSKANKLLGFVRRSSWEIRSQRTRRCLFLSVVRPHLGYATQIWAPQTIELIKRVERVQRRATKFILNLPFHCELTYEDRLQATDLLPISFWHEYLDLTFFFKMFNGWCASVRR